MTAIVMIAEGTEITAITATAETSISIEKSVIEEEKEDKSSLVITAQDQGQETGHLLNPVRTVKIDAP